MWPVGKLNLRSDTKVMSGGNAVLNFTSESERKVAASKIRNGFKNFEINSIK